MTKFGTVTKVGDDDAASKIVDFPTRQFPERHAIKGDIENKATGRELADLLQVLILKRPECTRHLRDYVRTLLREVEQN